MQHAHILIVEDDPITSAMLAGWARQLGATVTAAASPAAADAVLAEEVFDLILSDVHLPGNHRLQWIEQVLATDFPPPVVLLTGNPELETTLRAANLPVAGYLVKPPDFKELGLLIQRLVQEYRHRRELRALSREAAWLLTAAPDLPAGTEPIREKLLQLSRLLATESTRNPREADSGLTWRSAISETIIVLEKTKHSFRSKELGTLRQRLQRMIDGRTALRPEAVPDAAA